MPQNSNSILQQHPIPSAFPAHLFAHVCEKQYLCISEDAICELLQIERIKWMEQRFNNALAAIKDESAASLKAIKEDVAELSKYYGSELWKLDFAADEAGNLPPDLKRGVLSEDGIWNLLSDYREIQKKKQ
jgi:hypothetical protein